MPQVLAIVLFVLDLPVEGILEVHFLERFLLCVILHRFPLFPIRAILVVIENQACITFVQIHFVEERVKVLVVCIA